ncbi:NAD(P)H dehydrogenase (quinone) [Dysgonomonas sp. PH5-45]|uniref:NAD(P)H-dependent oxidoreductase n=1 Tax=unclassified Dysgonomonas TaxID=2630389 RepID=UPI0024752DC2|nr:MULTISPECIES: NAD(P)H-dependent oxidoreductase [unclassified Dysgonomonas]MDH6353715.1 NAD(P)H dehydrogenase (quinone) [Dysgonomonas sp. PH5-45]MDH6386618.1 NAD(P)H dehydrogenase (quinone) [Dysgonomonas sp. PH5-37]
MVTIILAHPWHGSFNKAILDVITKKYDIENTDYQIIDLYKDNFNPVLTEAELELYSKGEYLDPLVGKYQTIIKETDKLIFIFPIWWSTMPAILKGFFDKVLLVNFSHSYANGWTPLLNIKSSVVVTTSESPTENFKTSIENNFIKAMLNPVGIGNTTWINCQQTSHGSNENRVEFLNKVQKTV